MAAACIDKGKTDIDLWGNHAHQCPVCYKWRTRRGSMLDKSFVELGRRAGAIIEAQPDTAMLLHHHFTRAECAALFREKSTAKHQLSVDEIIGLDAKIAACPPGRDKNAMIRKMALAINELVQAFELSRKAKGLIIDLLIKDPYDLSKELWIDHTVRHTTCDTYRKDELTRVRSSETSLKGLCPL